MTRRRTASCLILFGLALAALALLRNGRETVERVMAAGDRTTVGPRLSLELEDLSVPRYPSGNPRQYVSAVRVRDAADGRWRKAEISVNHPLRIAGWWIYQQDFGPDEAGVFCTQLACVKDPLLPLAAVGSGVLLLGVFLLGWVRRGDFRDVFRPACSRRKALLSYLAAGVTVVLVAFVIGRVVLRPEPAPALQSVFLVPHVAAYAASYLMLLFAAFGLGRRFVPHGFVLMTIGLVVGAVWGKFAWGDWWQFDPKENWSFATWLAFALALQFPPASRSSRWLLRLGAILIVLTLTWVNFSRFTAGLHSYAAPVV